MWRIIFHTDLKWAQLGCGSSCLREELTLDTFWRGCAPLERASGSGGSVWAMSWFGCLKFCFASKCGSLIYPFSCMAVIWEWSLKLAKLCITKHLDLRRVFYWQRPAAVNLLCEEVCLGGWHLFFILSRQKAGFSWRRRHICNTSSAKI